MEYLRDYTASKIQGIVTPMLKNVLENYFSNFDANSFNVALPSVSLARVELNDLILKTDILNQFDIPFSVACGKVGKIHIDIGTTSMLYGAPSVDVTLSDIYLLVTPPSSVPYDAAADKARFLKKKRDALEAAVAKIQAAKEPAEKSSGWFGWGSSSDDDKKNPAEMNPLVVGIINNVKISITNIHVRYEDAKGPFSVGIVLKSLSAVSTDSNYAPAETGKDEKTFFKKADLVGLGLYWNTDSPIVFKNDKALDVEFSKMAELIADANNNELNYILGPIGTTVKAMVTMSPSKLDDPYSKPNFDVDIGMKSLDIGITYNQFREILTFGDGIERIQRGKQYLKFRPFDTPYKGNSKLWWKFAYNCVLDKVRRRDWKVVEAKAFVLKKQCDQYSKLYYKILSKEDEEASRAAATKLEDDMPNIDILRCRSEQEVYLKKTDDAYQTKKKNASWWQTAASLKLTPEEIKGVLSKKLSAEEAKKIEDEIEALNTPPPPDVAPTYPETYIDKKITFKLPQLKLDIEQEAGNGVDYQNVLNLQTINFDFGFQTRPSNSGMRVDLSMDDIGVTGYKHRDDVPVMVKAIKQEDNAKFISILFETHPLNSTASKKIKLDTKQLEITYDSISIQKLIDCFTWPSDVELVTVQNAASNALSTVKSATVDSAKAVAANTEEMDVDIQIHAPYILVPQDGDFTSAECILVLNFGNLVVRSIPSERKGDIAAAIAKANEMKAALAAAGPGSSSEISISGEEHPLEEGDSTPAVLKLMYNQYQIELVNVEILVALQGEDILAAVRHDYNDEPGVYHTDRPAPLLTTGDIILDLNQCLVADDSRYAKLKADVVIPLLDFQITDYRILKLLRLVTTLPIPTSGNTKPSGFIDGTPDEEFFAVNESDQLVYTDTDVLHQKLNTAKQDDETVHEDTEHGKAFDPEKATQLTNLILDIKLRQIKVVLLKKDDTSKSGITPLIKSELINMNIRYKTRTYGTTIYGSIGGMTSAYFDAIEPGITKDQTLYLIQTPMSTDPKAKALIRFHLFKLQDNIKMVEGAVRMKYDLEVDSMDVTVHQESLHVILDIVDSVVNELKSKKTSDDSTPPPAELESETNAATDLAVAVTKSATKQNPKDVDLNLTLLVNTFSVKLTSEAVRITKITIEEIIAEYQQKPLQKTIFAQLEGIEIVNLDVDTLYPKVLTCEAHKKLIIAEVVIYDDKKRAEDLPDMTIELHVVSPKLILLGSYVGNLLTFCKSLTAASSSLSAASSKAGTKVVQAAEVTYSKTSTKMGLKVQIDAPRVMLPKSDTVTDALLIDLGVFTVNNTISLEDAADSTDKGVIDTIEVHLEGVKVSRSILDLKAQDVESELYIVEPITIDGMVQRNLSSSWYAGQPALSISGCLNPVVVKISDSDVALAIACLLGLTSRLSSDTKKETDTAASAILDATGGDAETAPAPEPTPTPRPTLNAVALSVDVSLEQMALALYLSSPELTGKIGLVARDEKASLAKLSIDALECSLSNWNNSDLDVKLSLKSIILQDTRIDMGGPRDFIQPKSGKGEKPETDSLMLQLAYAAKTQTEGNLAYDVNLQTESLQIILDVEYVKTLLEFVGRVTATIPKSKSKAATKTPAIKDTTSKALGGSEDAHSKSEKPSAATPPSRVNAGVQINEIDILIIDDVQATDTNSLMINLGGSFTMSSSDTKSHGEGDFSLTSSTAVYNANKVAELRTEIVNFADIEIAADIDEKDGTIVSLNLPDTYVRVSAGTLFLITKILNRLSASNPSKDGTPVEAADLEDYRDAWNPTSVKRQAYWFLDQGYIAKKIKPLVPKKSALSAAQTKDAKQSFTVKSGKIKVSLEAGVGTMTTPLLTAETSIKAEIKDWSRNLTVAGRIGLSAAYNNTYVGMWEYILEPSEIQDPTNFGEPKRQPWQLDFNVGHRALPAGAVGDAPLAIDLKAPEVLELTVSKTALSVIQSLADNFGDSTKSSNAQDAEISVSAPPYLLRNEIQHAVSLNIDGTALTCVKDGHKASGDISLNSGEEITFGLLLDNADTPVSKRQLTLSIPDYKFKKVISVNHAQTRFYPLTPAGNSNSKFGILIDMVTTAQLSTLITLRSIVQVENQLDKPVTVSTSSKGKVTPIGSVQPGKVLYVPLNTAYASTDGFVFQIDGYAATTKPFNWVNSTSKSATSLSAKNSTASGLDAHFMVFSIIREAVLEDTEKTTALGHNYTLQLKSPVMLSNFLPTPLSVSVGTNSIGTYDPGNATKIIGVDPSTRSGALDLKLVNYQGQDWTYQLYFRSMETKSLNLIQFKGKDGKTLYLGCKMKVEKEITQLSIYYPYWIVNHTGLDITYKGDGETETKHLASDPGPLFFAYQKWSKNNTLFKVADSEWSDKMNLDAAMSAVFNCKGKTQDYPVTVAIAITENTMTKTVTFLPKYTINNTCPYAIVVQEKGADFATKLTVPANTSVPFWPKTRQDKDSKVFFQVDGSSEDTPSIFATRTGTSLLRLNNKYGGITANVHAMETKTTVTLSEFMPGDTPFLLVNDTTDLPIEFQQKNAAKKTVAAGQSQIYTWEDFTTEKAQTLLWNPANVTAKGFPVSINTDTTTNGTFKNGDKAYSWIAFPHGLRNILVVTENADLVKNLTEFLKVGKAAVVKSDGTTEADTDDRIAKMEVNLLLDGIGISLVDNVKAKEIMYLRLESTDVIWEEADVGGKIYKTIKDNRLFILELGYQDYISGKNSKRPASLTSGITVDFADFLQSKPNKKQLRRRAYQPGLKVGYKTYDNAMALDLSISNLQIDNQLPDAQFPRTFAISPIPQSAANETEVHPPLLLVNFKQRTQPNSTVKIVNATVILQEFKVAIDMGFISTITGILPSSNKDPSEEVAAEYTNDFATASKSNEKYFAEELEKVKGDVTQTILEEIQIYMLKLKATFTMTGNEDDSYIKSLLMGLGSVVVSVTDLPIKVDGLQIKNKSMTQKQLIDTITAHYTSGIVSNLYTVVLQLDVLGNPYQLLSGAVTGVTSLITEPFEGAMNGNLIEGVSNGVGAVLDGTVFGLTDTLGKITQSLGKGVNALGIPILGDLVSGLGKGLLFFGHITGNKDSGPPAIRLPRAIKPKGHLEPYSEYDTAGSIMYGTLLSSYPTAGDYLMHFVFKGATPQGLLLTKNMVFYFKVDPTSYEVGSANWSHKWTDFVSITKIDKTYEVVYNLPPSSGFFGNVLGGDKTLEVTTSGPEMCKYVLEKSEEIRKAAKAAEGK